MVGIKEDSTYHLEEAQVSFEYIVEVNLWIIPSVTVVHGFTRAFVGHLVRGHSDHPGVGDKHAGVKFASK